MILLGSMLGNTPVVSIQTGGELARLDYPVIDPANLSIVAYEVHRLNGVVDKTPLLLRIADVRELSDLGLIIDSEDEFVHPEDIVRLQDIYERHFRLVGIRVLDEHRHKLGKVTDFTLESGSFYVQQLTVRRPILKSLNDTELIIHRSQIIEINNTAIVVHSQAKAPEPELHEIVGSYVNPFRTSANSAPESMTPQRDEE